MALDRFKKLVKAEFGADLQHATPANVREFVEELTKGEVAEGLPSRIVLDEHCASAEEVFRDFFARVLDMPTEQAIIALWLYAVEMHFSTLENQYSESLAKLFPDTD